MFAYKLKFRNPICSNFRTKGAATNGREQAFCTRLVYEFRRKIPVAAARGFRQFAQNMIVICIPPQKALRQSQPVLQTVNVHTVAATIY